MRKFINFRMSKRGAGRRAWWGAGRGAGVARGAGRRAWCGRGAGRDLVHEIPPALISPFPLHQVPRVSSPVAGAVLVHETPPVLVLPLPLHQVPRVFSPVAGGRGASPLASSCFFVLGHHALEHSSRSRRAGVVPHRSLALVSSSWGTTPSSTAAVPAERAWCLTAR